MGQRGPLPTTMLKNILTAILALALLAIIFPLLFLPAITGTRSVIIRTGSMNPALPQSSMAYITPQNAYEVGDIVTFYSGTELVTHRLETDLSGNADLWKTKGDANDESDPYFVSNENILGRTIFYVPYLGLVAQAIEQPPVIATILLLAASTIAIPMILTPPATQKAPA